MRIQSAVLKAVARAASTELGRYAIDGVHLRKDRIEATNGRLLLMADVPEQDRDEHHTNRILNAASVKAIVADKLTKRYGVAQLSSDGALTYAGEAGSAIQALGTDAVFPDVDGVVPKDDDIGFTVTFAGHLLAKLAAAAKDVDEASECVTFAFQREKGETKAVRVTMGEGERKVRGCIMPMSL